MAHDGARSRGRYDEVPEAPRHRRMSRGRKPWALQFKSRRALACGWMAFPDWTTVHRYRTEADAEKARGTIARKDARLWEVRIVGPTNESEG